MKLVSSICLFVFLFSSQSAATAQVKEATIILDRTEIKIGEQIKAELKLVFPVTEDYSFAILSDTLTKEIEVVEISKIDTTYEGQNLSLKVMSSTLLLTSFDTGYLPLPPIYFYGTNDTLSTEPHLLHVSDVKVDMPPSDGQSEPEIAIKDIKDIKDKDFSFWEWMKINKYFLIGAILLAIGIWAYFKYIHPILKNKQVNVIPQKKSIPPFEVALKKLTAVDDQKLWQAGRIKEYHSSLSEIIREYIEEQFKLPALESTTGEINSALKNHSFDEEVVKDVVSMLQLADLVKFAKMLPLGDENQRSMTQAYSFIEKTKPAEIKEQETINTEVNLNV